MAKEAAAEPRDMARRLLRRHERTFAEEAGDFPRLVSALVHVDLDASYEELQEEA
jgi:hypothetical protein